MPTRTGATRTPAGPRPPRPPRSGTPTSCVERYGSRTAREENPDVDAETLAALVGAINELSLSLHAAAANAEPTEALVTSGYSAAVALSLAEAGTSGTTRDSLRNLLGIDALEGAAVHAGMNALDRVLDESANEDLALRSVNRLFVRPGLPLDEDYLDTATAEYGAPVTEADFADAPAAAARLVNDWVSRQTAGFIPSIVERFDPGTTLALLNALFLDATWLDAYAETGDIDFTGPDGRTRAVPAFGGEAELDTIEAEGVRGIELPYAGGRIAMLILVPDDLASFESMLDAERLRTLLAGASARSDGAARAALGERYRARPEPDPRPARIAVEPLGLRPHDRGPGALETRRTRPSAGAHRGRRGRHPSGRRHRDRRRHLRPRRAAGRVHRRSSVHVPAARADERSCCCSPDG